MLNLNAGLKARSSTDPPPIGGHAGETKTARWALSAVAGLAGVFGGVARAEPSVSAVAVVEKVRASQPPHCMSDGQWHDPLGASPLNLFDGSVASAWVVCPEAAATPDYALDITFEGPVALDRVRIQQAEPAGNHPTRIEIGLHNRGLSKSWPVWFQSVNFTGEPHLDLTLAGRMPWNPQLVKDVGFVERRREAGLNQYDVPVPLPVDRITVVLRAADASKGPVALGEIELYLGAQRIPIEGVPGARVRHAEYLGQGLTRALSGRYLVAGERALHFLPDGEISALSAADLAAGKQAEPALRQFAGRWRVVGGRLELLSMAAENGKASRPGRAQPRAHDRNKLPSGPPVTEDGFTVVNVRVDEAPTVKFIDGPFEGLYQTKADAAGVQAATPASAPASKPASVSAAPKTTGEDDLPFPAGDDEEDGLIPIP